MPRDMIRVPTIEEQIVQSFNEINSAMSTIARCHESINRQLQLLKENVVIMRKHYGIDIMLQDEEIKLLKSRLEKYENN